MGISQPRFSFRLVFLVNPRPHDQITLTASNENQILPSPDLTWQPCYTFVNPRFLCARLSLPLDHLSPATTDQKVHVALLLLPALTNTDNNDMGYDTDTTDRYPINKENDKNKKKSDDVRKQPLLLNPGGPGGSGTLLALLAGQAIQTIVGGDRAVIGFDPRGVPFTTPGADCWSRYLTGDGCDVPPSGLGRLPLGRGAGRGYQGGGGQVRGMGRAKGGERGTGYGEGGCEDVAGGWRHRLECKWLFLSFFSLFLSLCGLW